MDKKKAITAIEKEGALITFPINNAPLPRSIWSVFFPKKKMRWEWDDNGDAGVADLWHFRTELSSSGKVVYSKWFKGRATFFSKSVFTALYRLLAVPHVPLPLSRKILQTLEEDSPLSTKELKKRVKKNWGIDAKAYDKALKELWDHCHIVGFGEVDDGAFPSLAVGAATSLFEELTTKAEKLKKEEALKILNGVWDKENLFLKQALKLQVAEKERKTPTQEKKKKLTLRGSDLKIFESN